MIDKRKFEAVLDWTAIAGNCLFLSLAFAGVLPWVAVAWSIGIFTGWLARCHLH